LLTDREKVLFYFTFFEKLKMNQKDISGPLKNLESSAAAADISKSQSCDIFNNQALTKQLVCQNNFFFLKDHRFHFMFRPRYSP
jgi:hypothetical protein